MSWAFRLVTRANGVDFSLILEALFLWRAKKDRMGTSSVLVRVVVKRALVRERGLSSESGGVWSSIERMLDCELLSQVWKGSEARIHWDWSFWLAVRRSMRWMHSLASVVAGFRVGRSRPFSHSEPRRVLVSWWWRTVDAWSSMRDCSSSCLSTRRWGIVRDLLVTKRGVLGALNLHLFLRQSVGYWRRGCTVYGP